MKIFNKNKIKKLEAKIASLEALLEERERDVCDWRKQYCDLLVRYDLKIEEMNDCIDSLDNELVITRRFLNEKGLAEEGLLYVVENFPDTINK